MQYLLTVTSLPGGGTFTITPPSPDGYYAAGATVQINATANPGYTPNIIVGNGGAGSGSLVMNAPQTVEVSFLCTWYYLYLPTELGSGPASVYFQILTGAGCQWGVSSNAAWLGVGSPASGMGPAAVAYSVSENDGASRSATLTITQDQGTTNSVPLTQAGPSTSYPSPISLTPSSGTGVSQSFNLHVYNPKGYSAIAFVGLELFDGYKDRSPCNLYLDLSSSIPLLYLAADEEVYYLPPVQIPSPTATQNSQCIVDPSRSAVSGSGDLLTVRFNLIFKSAFAGTQPISARAATIADSNFQPASVMVGTWTVPAGAAITISPNPIVVTDGSSLGTATITYSAPVPVKVYANQTLFCGGNTAGTCVTGKWVSNGMTFTLKDAVSGVTLTSAQARVVSGLGNTPRPR